jgi:hypothetical protein
VNIVRERMSVVQMSKAMRKIEQRRPKRPDVKLSLREPASGRRSLLRYQVSWTRR